MDAFEKDLAARLRRAGGDAAVPPAVDAAILGAAAEAADQFRRSRRLRLVRVAGASAAAAAAVLVFTLGGFLSDRAAPETASLAVLPSPRFGIADAWRASRGLAVGDSRLDLDGDGTADALDAEQILARIVDLDAPRRNS
jgi:hypothetical protein